MTASKETSDKKNQQSESKNAEAKKSSAKAASASKAEFDVDQEIDELIEVFGEDFSEIEMEEALQLIDQWQGFLSKTKDAGVKELAGDLKELQKLLKGGKADGQDISEALIHLGERTTEFADQAEDSKQAVQKLGKQLRKAGTSVAKAEEQEYHEQFDILMEKTEGNELTSLPVDDASQAIDQWIHLLSKTEGEAFQQVASSLKELKQSIRRNNAKPETIAKALHHVAEQTSNLASEAPRGFKGAVQKLGKQLAKVADSMSSNQEK